MTDIADILKKPEDIKFAFQPVVHADTGEIYGYEALMRPAPFSPLDVVDYCIKSDLIDVLEEITMLYSIKAFLNNDLEGKIFINSFPGACMSEEFSTIWLEEVGWKIAGRIVLEMLEYTELDIHAWQRKLEEFERGNEGTGNKSNIAIDDYGVDREVDLARIDMYHPTMVKIDRSLVSNIDSDVEKQDKVLNIIKLMKEKDILILAEGIETKAEYEYFLNLPIDFMQGYYIQKPKIYEN
ncbi:MAG: EAL domain-containing protein [Lachnospiraceae bacterium]|nr:EAL domain-containing protein [Lachnospiraceae bacterium]